MTSRASHRSQLLDRLRAEVSGRSVSTRAGDAMPLGLAAIDAKLAQGGLSNALHDLAPASPDLSQDAAATLFAAGMAGRFAAQGSSIVWAVSRFDLYAPGLEQAGLAADRIIFVEARTDDDVLAVMEDALRYGALAAVVGEVKRAGMTATRRLQLAASEGKTPALLLRKWRRRDICPLAENSAATTRWRIGCVPSPARQTPGVNRQHWHVELVRQRNGNPFSLTVEAWDAQGRLALPAAVADRAAAQAEPVSHVA